MTALYDELADTLENMGSPRTLLVGDMILDRYVWGNAARISQEAPIPVLSVARKEWRPGGAANVVNALAHLGCEVTACGAIGGDEDGSLLARRMMELTSGRSKLFVDPGRPTTVKTRFVGYVQSAGRAAHHVLRVDEEVTDPLPPGVERQVLGYLESAAGEHDCIICQDYNKGMLTENILAELISLASAAGCPVLVDPALGRSFDVYSGVTALVPNRYEATVATGIEIVDEATAHEACRKLASGLSLGQCLLKMDRDGMYLYLGSDRGVMISTLPLDVYDVTGAGDVVTAVFGALIAAGEDFESAARIANAAAGIAVGKFGCAPVPREELLQTLRSRDRGLLRKLVTVDALNAILAERRARGEKVAFTNGCFDLLHQGHIELVKFSREQADMLVVGMNSDRSVRELKGPNRPILSQQERAGILAALSEVDYIVLFDTVEVTPLIRALKPDVLVKGADYRPDQVVGHEVVESYGGEIRLAPLVEGISTTNIVERVLNSYSRDDEGGQENGEPEG